MLTKEQLQELDKKVVGEFRAALTEAGINPDDEGHRTPENAAKAEELWKGFADSSEAAGQLKAALDSGEAELPEELMGMVSGGGSKGCNDFVVGAAMTGWACLSTTELTGPVGIAGWGGSMLSAAGGAIYSAVK